MISIRGLGGNKVEVAARRPGYPVGVLSLHHHNFLRSVGEKGTDP